MSREPALLITIDTEGDNLWARPRSITTENARWLPRFQALCARHGLKPTYLTNHEMAVCPGFVAFGREVLRDRSGEIGMHLHAWNSPPLDTPLTGDDHAHHPPLIAYPADVLRAKVDHMTDLLENTFGVKMLSHRAGRWGFDATYLQVLVERGYRADCSVTPHMFWRYGRLAGDRERIVDYRRAPEEPYHPDPADVTRPGTSPLLELPMTVVRCDPVPLRPLRDALPPTSIAARAIAKLVTGHVWLRPRRGNLGRMTWLLEQVTRRGRAYAQLILHSSELMPGGSPYFPGRDDVEALYRDLEALFDHARPRFRGATLAEFAAGVAS
jgi:hypothetical protein